LDFGIGPVFEDAFPIYGHYPSIDNAAGGHKRFEIGDRLFNDGTKESPGAAVVEFVA
jgi:hypothetical protein